MKCKEIRTIFDIFKVYNCKKCEYYKDLDTIIIGNQYIFIYHIFNNCVVDDEDYKDLIFDSLKMKILFKDTCYNANDNIIMFLEYFNLEKYYNILEILLEFNMNIQIISL